jgi:cytochrome b involved in lipid metabolism
MKRIAYTAFVMFWTVTATLLVVGGLSPRPDPVELEATVLPRIKADELAQHNSADDCWMAIRGKVYDFTAYIPDHPTPAHVMTDWCGKEATEAYETKGYGAPHSDFADELMEPYLIGVFEE